MANEHSQIIPSMQPTATVADFKFWCQKVLPLVYDDSLSYYEVLNKMVVYLNQVIDNINADIENVEELEADFLLLQDYVNNFFDDIDQLVTYTERAEAAETSAISYAASAAESATNASTSALNAMDAKDAAVAAKNQAQAALTNAQTAATNAAASATAAAASATAADASKDAATASALSASGSATNASTSATAAQNSATLADAARTAAQTAAGNASDSATAAATSADAAETAAATADGAKAQAMIATIEETTTASKAYAVGDYLIYNGVLYVVTTSITSGDTITPDTNCKVAVLGDDVNAVIKSSVTNLETVVGNTIIPLSKGYINTSGSTVDVTTIVDSESFKYAVVDCSEGDYFTLNYTGGENARGFCFIDDDGNVLKVAPSSDTEENIVLKAPIQSSKLIINTSTNKPSVKGISESFIRNEYTKIMPDALTASFKQLFIASGWTQHSGRRVYCNRNHVEVTRNANGSTYSVRPVTGENPTYIAANAPSTEVWTTLYNNGNFVALEKSVYISTTIDDVSLILQIDCSGEQNNTVYLALATVDDSGETLTFNTQYYNAQILGNKITSLKINDTLKNDILQGKKLCIILNPRGGYETARNTAYLYFNLIAQYQDIQSKSLIETMIAKRTNTMTAPSNLTTGDYIIAQDKLYKVTQNIANGAGLVVNTNVVETTIGAELKALA